MAPQARGAEGGEHGDRSHPAPARSEPVARRGAVPVPTRRVARQEGKPLRHGASSSAPDASDRSEARPAERASGAGEARPVPPARRRPAVVRAVPEQRRPDAGDGDERQADPTRTEAAAPHAPRAAGPAGKGRGRRDRPIPRRTTSKPLNDSPPKPPLQSGGQRTAFAAAASSAEGRPPVKGRPAVSVARVGRTKAAPGRPDASTPQAGLSGWRQYVSQSGGPGGSTAAGAARQVFRHAQQEVVRQARLTGGNGRSTVTVQLHPPELGRMRLEVEMLFGKLEVRIRVENAEVREALRAEVQNLDRNLRGMQLEPARLEIGDYPAGRQGGSGQAARQGAGQHAPAGAFGAGGPEAAIEPAEWALFAETGAVDCLV